MNNSRRVDGHTARKRFGQNFLHDQRVINDIVAVIYPRDGEQLVEIGPGLAALTEPVCEKVNQLTVVELDRDLAARLRTHPFIASKLTIIEADALKFDFAALAQERGDKLRVFGNLPYNISTPLLFHLLEAVDSIQDMHFMLQKEVIDRLAAGPGSKSYGRLSVMVQYWCDVIPALIVPPGAFRPPPKVTSAVVRLTPRSSRKVEAIDYALFSRVTNEAFAQRRKTLRNALSQLVRDEGFVALGIDAQARAETLAVDDFVRLSNWVAEHGLPA